MKLTELLIENNLRSYEYGAAQSRLGPHNPGAPGTVVELKRQLQRFQLEFENQPANPAQKAWIGDMSDEWTQALSDAVIQWKQSILRQDPNARVDARTPEFSPQEIRILLRSRLYGPGSENEGLLIMDGGRHTSNDPLPTWSGRTIDLSYVIDTPPENVSTTRDMLAAVGFSGWAVILDEFLNKRGAIIQSSNQQRIVRLEKELYAYQNAHPRIWLQSWQDDILQEDGENLTATFANGNEMPFDPQRGGVQTNAGGRASLASALYRYFRELGNGLLRKYEQVAQENAARQENEGAGSGPAATPLSTQQIQNWAIDMKNALAEGWFDFIPGVAGVDELSVQDLMSQLRTPEDWDKGSAKYQDLANENLAQRLAESLNDEDYESIVFRALSSIGRINHIMLHSSIVWGNETDSINVEFENETYTIMKARVDNKVIAKKGSRQLKDAILVDDLLKIAIEQTGGTIPDLTLEPSPENLAAAAEVVIAGVQMTAPWMVPYYVKATPFDQSVNPQMGVNRLRGLQQQAARLQLNGLKDESIITWVAGEVREDAEWLVGTKSVHFDERWAQDEGDVPLSAFGASLSDDIEGATDEEKALLDRIHREETRAEAFADLANTSDLETRYERIYRLFKREHGEYIDQRIFDNTDDLGEFIFNSTPINDDGFALIVESIGIAQAAPYTVAQLFEDSMYGPWWTGWIGTDEEKLEKMIYQIVKPDDYAIVNEYYKKAGNGDLIEDIDGEYQGDIFGETEIVAQLKAALGIANAPIASADLDPGLYTKLTELGTDQSTAKLQEVKDAFERPANNYFVDVEDGKAGNLINSDKVETVFRFLEEVANANEYDDEQQEIWFDILAAIDIELLRVKGLRDGRRNRNRYEYWQELRDSAETEWFS